MHTEVMFLKATQPFAVPGRLGKPAHDWEIRARELGFTAVADRCKALWLHISTKDLTTAGPYWCQTVAEEVRSMEGTLRGINLVNHRFEAKERKLEKKLTTRAKVLSSAPSAAPPDAYVANQYAYMQPPPPPPMAIPPRPRAPSRDNGKDLRYQGLLQFLEAQPRTDRHCHACAYLGRTAVASNHAVKGCMAVEEALTRWQSGAVGPPAQGHYAMPTPAPYQPGSNPQWPKGPRGHDQAWPPRRGGRGGRH